MTSRTCRMLLFTTLLASVAFSGRAEDCAEGVPDCDHTDHGGCGNSCCLITMQVSATVKEIVENLNSSVATTNGPDGMYSFAPMYSGDVGFAQIGDIGSMAQFIRHTDPYPCPLSGTCVFKDTIDILVTSADEEEHTTHSQYARQLVKQGAKKVARTNIKFFSISNIGGSYGDSSQNYKNILMLIRGLPTSGSGDGAGQGTPPFTIVQGCGKD